MIFAAFELEKAANLDEIATEVKRRVVVLELDATWKSSLQL